MPKCHRIYTNCVWQVSTEWCNLGSYSALLTKVFRNYATLIVRVCVRPISPKTSKLDLTDKSKLQFLFGSKAMASLYDHLCYHSLSSTDPLLKEILFYLPTRFHSHFFITLLMNTPRMMNQYTLLTLRFLHFIPTIQLTFLKHFYIIFIFNATPNFTTRTSTGRQKKTAGGKRLTTCTCPWQVILSPRNPRFWQGISPAPSIQLQTTPPFAGEIAGAQKKSGCSIRLLINAACKSKRALSPAADSKSSPVSVQDCGKVANRAEIGGIAYRNPACPLFCRVASRHISSPNSDRDEYICRSSAPNASSSEL